MDASPLPLLSDLGDPFGHFPAFDEVVSDEEPEELDDEVDYDKDSRDAKSRYVLKELEAGKHRYRRGDKWICPFCIRIIDTQRHSMIQHAVGIGQGSENNRSALVMAQHAAYGVFLKKLLARDIRLGLAQPPPPKKANKDKKARKGRKPWRR